MQRICGQRFAWEDTIIDRVSVNPCNAMHTWYYWHPDDSPRRGSGIRSAAGDTSFLECDGVVFEWLLETLRTKLWRGSSLAGVCSGARILNLASFRHASKSVLRRLPRWGTSLFLIMFSTPVFSELFSFRAHDTTTLMMDRGQV